MVAQQEMVRRIAENRRLIDDLIKPEIYPPTAAPVPAAVALNDMLIADATPVWIILTGPAAEGEILVAGAAPFTQVWGTVDLLSLTHGDTTPQAVSQGSLIYGDAGPTWNELVIGAATNFLRSDGVDAAWSPILVTDLPAHNLLSAQHGDTVVQAVSRGSLVYGDATPDWNELVIGALSTHLESDGVDITWQPNIIMADDTWIGLALGTAHIIFDDTPAGDNIRFENCTHVGIDNLLEHNGDLDTYLIFSPDFAAFRVGNVDMLQMQELAAAQDNVTVNATQADVDFVVEALALGNAFWVEGLTGAIVVTGPSLTVPDDWWEGLGAAAGRLAFNSTPAPDQVEVTAADLNFVTAAHGIIHTDGVAAGWVLRADGTRYVPASAVATVPLPPVAQNDMLIANAVPEWSILGGPAAQGDVLIAGAAPLIPAWGTVFTANMTLDDGVLDSPSLGFVGASNDQALLHFDDTARSLVVTLEDDKAEAMRIIDDGGADDYVTIVSTNAQREVAVNQDQADIDLRWESAANANAAIFQASDGFIGFGRVPVGHVDVYDAALNITATYYGIFNQHTKTAGVTGVGDSLYGIYNTMIMNHIGGNLDYNYGVYNRAQLIDGTINQRIWGIFNTTVMTGGIVTDSVYAFDSRADIDAGTITNGNVAAGLFVVDIEAAVASIGGDVWGVYISVDADQDPVGTAYVLYLIGATNVDYGIYQVGGQNNYFSGNVGIADTTPTEGRLSVINSVADNGAIAYLYRNQGTVNQSGLYLFLDNASDDEAAMTIRHDGTGDLFQLFDGATQVVDIDNTGHMLLNSTTGTTGHTLQVTRNLASGSTDNHMALFENTNAGDDQRVVRIEQSAAAIALDVNTTGQVEAGYFNRTTDVGTQPVVTVVQDSVNGGTPVLQLQQDDVSEGFFNLVGSDRGVVVSANSVASGRVELNGTVYLVALYTNA